MADFNIHMSNNSTVVSRSLKYLPILVIFLILHTVIIYELLVILPQLDAHKTVTFYSHALFGTFLYFNIMGSAYYLIVTDTSIMLNTGPATLNKGWTYCYACEDNAPPHSRHCYICNVCILRRDHHCALLSRCVGYHNHRYYISLLFYITVGSWYCNYINIDYAVEVLGKHSYADLASLLLPFVSWLVGRLPAYTFAVASISFCCVFASLFFTFYLCYAAANVAAGRVQNSVRAPAAYVDAAPTSSLTTPTSSSSARVQPASVRHNAAEITKEVRLNPHPPTPTPPGVPQRRLCYDRGTAWLNVREIFGEKYLVSLLCPFIESQLPGDGVTFVGDPMEIPKNM